MQIGTLDAWLEKRFGGRRETPAKRVERKVNGGYVRQRSLGPALADRPRIESIERINVPAIAEPYEWLYGTKVRLENQTSRGRR